MKTPRLSIVVPCYNEEEALPDSAQRLAKVLEHLKENHLVSEDSFLCFVNDGSRDKTWQIIQALHAEKSFYQGINLSRNFGHQGALLAGLYTAPADIYVSIDADLQDDEWKIVDMVKLYYAGNDIVYGCRDDRQTDTWFKKTTAGLFYKFRNFIGCYTIPQHADYRLMSARAVAELKKYGEVNLFLRGIIPLLGFPSERVYYSRKAREKGESKYPLSKMLKLAWNGIINFSDVPLMMCIWMGLFGFLCTVLMICWSLWSWYQGDVLPGWTSTVIIVCLFSSFQFMFTGIMGLYIGKIFKETKRRPLFTVQDDLTTDSPR